MAKIAANKRKIINDPVYGFISYPFESNFRLIEHPFLQRLRRVRQLGMTNFVYPGANHTRFQHTLGAAYLMTQAIQVIQSKGHKITLEEAEAVINAILMHDIGHGPFSHSLEKSIIEGINHEELSLLFMRKLNEEFGQSLKLAIDIYTNNYPKKFLHQLVSGQLDMDRLDYLKRDSFFTGVTEGVIGSDRIIKMLNVSEDELVIDIKGIYSIEKFLIARRLMYWQVYLHKTVVSAENLLIMILKRARELRMNGQKLFASPSLDFFLHQKISHKDFLKDPENRIIGFFSELDDSDIMSAAKVWCHNEDQVLSHLCRSLINRRLFRLEISKKPFTGDKIEHLKKRLVRKIGINEENSHYFIQSGELTNNMYSSFDDKIKIIRKNGQTQDIAEASDLFDLKALSIPVKKYYLTYPKELDE